MVRRTIERIIMKTHVRWLKMPALLQAMKDAHASWYSRPRLYSLIKAGKLTLPRLPSGQPVVTETMIEEIIQAFVPGGTGEWHYIQNSQ